MKYIITIFFTVFVLKMQSQSLSELLQEFDNLEAFESTTFYYDPGEKRNTGLIYKGDNRIKIVNVDNDWLSKITIEIKNNPNELFSYISTNNYDYSAYALFVSIYDLEMEMPEYVMLDMAQSMVKDPNLYPEIRNGEDNNTLITGFMSTLKQVSKGFTLRLENQLKAKNILELSSPDK